MLKENDEAPDFSLSGSDGKMHNLKEFSGKILILYFYPKDNTPGCTIEAKAFNTVREEIRNEGAEVVGLSADNLESHNKFCSDYKLDFLLLSDPDRKTIKAYDSYGSRGIFGPGTLRKTFIIGKDGKIMKIFQKVKPLGHEKEVLAFIKDSR